MSIGAWQCPGLMMGTGHERGAEIYRLLRENFGDAWAQSFDSASVPANIAEDIAAARLLLLADRFVERWRYQSDPTTMVEEFVCRWEGILGITPDSSQTWTDRRRAVKARRAQCDVSRGGIDRVVQEAFSPWEVHVHFLGKDNATMFWPGAGNTTAELFWYSTIALITVEYVPPASATRAEIDSRVNGCTDALDDLVSAWTDFNFSETQSYGTNAGVMGFFLDQPNLDVAVLAT